MANAEDAGTFAGADDFREMMKKALVESANGAPGTARARFGTNRAGDPAARKAFMVDFEALCKKYGVDSVDFKAFVKDSLQRVL